MHDRLIIVSIDSIMELFKSYMGQDDIPLNTMPVRLLVKPTEQGKFCLECESDEWPIGLPALNVHFDIRRNYAI